MARQRAAVGGRFPAPARMVHPKRLATTWLVGLALLAGLCRPLRAQETTPPPATQVDGYQVQQTYDIGYRFSTIDGSAPNYDTFVNLQSGPRLLDGSLLMHAVTGQSGWFDNLSLTTFGLGGDPDEGAQLHIDQGKWFDFSASWRRDENVFGYNLLVNPLNPANNAPEVGVSTALHNLDLSHRISSYDLRLFPLSKLSVRLSYANNVQTGPATTTLHGNVDTQVLENYSTNMNSFQIGLDYKPVARTVISYDQFFEYFKNDTQATGVPYNYQLSNGVPVDLGFVFTGSTPCTGSILSTTTTPPTVKPSCAGYLSYSQVNPQRTKLPTERLGLTSNYWKKISITGSYSYNYGVNTIDSYQILANGLTSVTRGTDTTGFTSADRVDVQGDGTLIWNVTSKFHITDVFNLYRFENPGDYLFGEQTYFAQAPLVSGTGSMLLPPALFNPTNCPAPYTAATCPQHTTSSAADYQTGATYNYLGNNQKTDELLFSYDFASWWGGRIGYRYNNQKVAEGSASFVTGDVYDPGSGASLADRGNCALVSGKLPAACTANADGSVTYNPGVVPVPTAWAEAANIQGDSLIVGAWVRPAAVIRLNTDMEFYSADQAFDRIDPRQEQKYLFQGLMTPAPWFTLNATVNAEEQEDNVIYVDQLAHNRLYTLIGTFLPADKVSFDLGFTYDNVYSQAIECFSLGTSPVPAGVGACPVPNSPVTQGALATYSDMDHYFYVNAVAHPIPRVSMHLGFAGSYTRGSTLLLDPLAPSGTLEYDYLRPTGGLSVDLVHGVAFTGDWGFYDYGQIGAFPVGLAPIPGENFHANLVTLAMRYSF